MRLFKPVPPKVESGAIKIRDRILEGLLHIVFSRV